MKFVYIATGLVFLLSYWISDNVYNQLIRISQTQLELLKAGACQLLLNTAAKKPIRTYLICYSKRDWYCYLILFCHNEWQQIAVLLLLHDQISYSYIMTLMGCSRGLTFILGQNGLKSFLKNGIVYLVHNIVRKSWPKSNEPSTHWQYQLILVSFHYSDAHRAPRGVQRSKIIH